MNAAVALALCLLTTVAPPAPAAPSATYVIGPGQERRIERVLAEAVAGLVLLDAAVEQDRVVARFGRAPGADASFAVTLVHPARAPGDGLPAGGGATPPARGPAPATRLSALAAALRNGDSQPLVAWTQPSPEPAPPALAKAARRLPGGEPGEWALQAAAPPAGGDVRAGDTPPPDQPEAVLRDDEGDPSDPAWRQVITRAEHLAERGDRDAAREALAPMSGRAGASNWLRVDLAAAYAQIGDVERARALVAPALATDAR